MSCEKELKRFWFKNCNIPKMICNRNNSGRDTVGENIIPTSKIRNNYNTIQSFIFSISLTPLQQ